MGCKYSIFTVRQGDTLGIQRRQVFQVNTVRCGVYQGCMGCNTKGVGCIIFKGVGCIVKGVWGVNILLLLCDKVIHLGYNGDKFFR